ncbi:tRNA uridine-5-carboxymethylaminomethyl(34) synthesis GTPase MnmE [bacterium]|nr:tRNA uridine-5-carboxymethylaminomethyl(34) synthesis GTPase MnmE [bacterium]
MLINTSSYNESDTISAEITPPGQGGVSVVRISGKHAFRIVKLLIDKKLPDHGTARLCRIRGTSEGFIDEAIVTAFKAPHSYTGEDVIEVALHGNMLIVSEVLKLIYKAGARPASAGEFTFRAFLNGRIDLTQAEAVEDIISANSQQAIESAFSGLAGGIRENATKLTKTLSGLLIGFELELDFVEESVEILDAESRIKIINELLSDTEDMIEGYDQARKVKSGVKVAIIGAPNVGKSSLFNMLTNSDKAITNIEAGTTRDVLEASTIINGVRFVFSDTAGMRQTLNEVEAEGVKRAIDAGESADIILNLEAVGIDTCREFEVNDQNRVINVLNKIDLGIVKEDNSKQNISVKENIGIDRLKKMLYNVCMGKENLVGKSTITRERHYRCLLGLIDNLKEAKKLISEEYPQEIVAEELREGLHYLDELTGKSWTKDILETIFSKFCIGK